MTSKKLSCRIIIVPIVESNGPQEVASKISHRIMHYMNEAAVEVYANLKKSCEEQDIEFSMVDKELAKDLMKQLLSHEDVTEMEFVRPNKT